MLPQRMGPNDIKKFIAERRQQPILFRDELIENAKRPGQINRRIVLAHKHPVYRYSLQLWFATEPEEALAYLAVFMVKLTNFGKDCAILEKIGSTQILGLKIQGPDIDAVSKSLLEMPAEDLFYLASSSITHFTFTFNGFLMMPSLDEN